MGLALELSREGPTAAPGKGAYRASRTRALAGLVTATMVCVCEVDA